MPERIARVIRRDLRFAGWKAGRKPLVFKRVLIANRGEIAIRIARAAHALGIETVALFAPEDALGLHTRVATRAKVSPETLMMAS